MNKIPKEGFREALKLISIGDNVIFRAIDFQSSNTKSIEKPSQVIRSLAIEEFFLQFLNDHIRKETILSRQSTLHEKNEPGSILFLYNTTQPCVVVGRNQNTFAETYIQKLNPSSDKQNMLPLLVRRKSGGGCVYHDHGCLCFSFISSRDKYCPDKTIRIVEKAIQQIVSSHVRENSLMPEITLGPRHDIFLNMQKITGSAMRMLQFAAYHHGTILVDSHVKNIKKFLEPMPNINSALSIQTKGSVSVRSSVTTLAHELCGSLSSKAADLRYTVLEKLSSEFSASCSFDRPGRTCHRFDLRDAMSIFFDARSQIHTNETDISSWEWTFGGNPNFVISIGQSEGNYRRTALAEDTQKRLAELNLRQVTITVTKGIVSAMEVKLPEELNDFPCAQCIQSTCQVIVGSKFRRSSLQSALEKSATSLCTRHKLYSDEPKRHLRIHFNHGSWVTKSLDILAIIEIICDACCL